MTIKATAARVLSTGEATEDEARSLAAYALGDDAQPRTARSMADLKRLLANVEGREGQTERAAAIKAEMARG